MHQIFIPASNNSFIKNVEEFKKIDLLPVPTHFPGEGSVLMKNQAGTNNVTKSLTMLD